MSGATTNTSEIKTFNDFLDKIKLLPKNSKYSNEIDRKNSTPVKGTINPPPSKPTHLLLTLKPLRGEVKTLRVPFSQTVEELRESVSELFKISDSERCRLIRGGKALSDDKQILENVFGTASDSQILHVLEKPPTAPVASNKNDSWKSFDHPIWAKIDGLLQSDAGIDSGNDRSVIIEKFRKSLL